MDAPAAPSTAARLTSAWSVWASMPSGMVPVAGSIPAMPEQKTKPPATIAWLYGPSATGASSLDTASLVIGRLLWWMASQRSRGLIGPGTRKGPKPGHAAIALPGFVQLDSGVRRTAAIASASSLATILERDPIGSSCAAADVV